jgi:hypothetical protein
VTCICHPKLCGREAEIGRIAVPGQPRHNEIPTSTENKLGMMAHTCHLSIGGKPKIGGSWNRPDWAKHETLSPK